MNSFLWTVCSEAHLFSFSYLTTVNLSGLYAFPLYGVAFAQYLPKAEVQESEGREL